MAKKASGIPSVTHPEAVEVALCHGWIDGQRRGVDDQWFAQRFTPRRARSRWSRLMREKAEELIAAGAMRPAGLAEVERAKADGALGRGLRAAQHRHRARRPARRVAEAQRPETRARRIAKYVAMCAAGETVH